MYHEGKKIACQVTVNGQALPEYQTKVSRSTITCWIPAEHGEAFEITVVNKGYPTTNPSKSLAALPIIDGNVKFSRQEPKYNEKITFKGKWLDDKRLQLARFNRFTTISDDDDSERGEGKAGALSTVRVEIWTARWYQCASEREAYDQVTVSPVINEREAKEDGRTLDTLITLDPPTAVDSENEDWYCENQKLYLTFLFKYATRDLLIAQGTIPSLSEVEENGDDAETSSYRETTVGLIEERPLKRRRKETPQAGPSNPRPPNNSSAPRQVQDEDQMVSNLSKELQNLPPAVRARVWANVKPEDEVKPEREDESMAGRSQQWVRYTVDADGSLILEDD
ncbi:hypothetical protein HDV00_002230 [Rhizophlyctis rosea]|nr:hypothetical protein HDV00_002230 [Rhizophlyctis rosea]